MDCLKGKLDIEEPFIDAMKNFQKLVKMPKAVIKTF